MHRITNLCKVKGKIRPRRGHDDLDGVFSSTISLTSALGRGGWLRPRLSHFTPGKETRYPLHRRLVGPQGWSGRVLKIFSPPGFDSRTVQPVYRLQYRDPLSYMCRILNAFDFGIFSKTVQFSVTEILVYISIMCFLCIDRQTDRQRGMNGLTDFSMR